MALSLSYSSLTNIKKGKFTSKFGGSSKFQVIDNKIVEKEKCKNTEVEANVYIEDGSFNRYLKPFSENENEKEVADRLKQFSTYSIVEDEIVLEDSEVRKEENKKTYKLNKSKLKKKCISFSRLEKSRSFLAFYSLSFPVGLIDNSAYKVFNTWLTRCRKDCGLKSYLWVAERQKNGTIHFHLLTNDFMQIKTVNNYMAKALKTEKKKGNEALLSVDTEKYNGVDVKKVDNNRKALILYLAKYISKNDIEFYRLPWHCSRDISRLFTSENFKIEEFNQCAKHLPRGEEYFDENYNYYDAEHHETLGFKFNPTDENFKSIDKVNEKIYNK
jgi:hypothetical protein